MKGFGLYIQDEYRQDDLDHLRWLIGEYPLGVLITMRKGCPVAGHVPFILSYSSDAVVLLGHLARANSQWADMQSQERVQIIFNGPQAYVSPRWYATPGVPTWNYAVAHVHGTARLVEDVRHVAEIIERQEAFHERRELGEGDNEISGVSYDPQRLGVIVGIEVAVERIYGKFKLSQSRPMEDQRQVMERLKVSSQPMAEHVASLMREEISIKKRLE